MSLWSDIGALNDSGNGGSDIGKGNDSFNAAEVGSMTGVSSNEAAGAGHAARDDMAESGNMGISSDRHGW